MGLSFWSWFWLPDLSCAPTSRHQSDAAIIIVGINDAVQTVNKIHIARKHTIAKGKRQAIRNKISVKVDGLILQRQFSVKLLTDMSKDCAQRLVLRAGLLAHAAACAGEQPVDHIFAYQPALLGLAWLVHRANWTHVHAGLAIAARFKLQ